MIFLLVLFLQVQTVSGSVTVQAKADDPESGVSSVQCQVDAVLIGTLSAPTTQPDIYAFPWDTTKTANGQHVVTCKATNGQGLTGTATQTVNVSNVIPDTTPPVISIITPIADMQVTGKISVEARATDDTVVRSMALLIQGKQVQTATGPALSYNWNTSPYKRQTVALKVTAVDPAGNIGTKAIHVTVK